MKNRLIKVEGHADLARDPVSGAIINTDSDALIRYKAKLKREKDLAKRVEHLEGELEDINTKMDDITTMLKEALKQD